MIKEKAYAKINLTLNILNKREDGYHNLKSVMIPINLYDELSFEHNDNYILESNYNLNTNDNIITKTFLLIKEKYNISNVKIILKKNIPTEAGLAGGSADATATIRGLNKLFNLNLSTKEQNSLANQLGSDTLFTLHNKPAIVSSRGDIINFLDVNPNFNILLIKPNIGISTKEAFNNIKEFNVKHNDNIIEHLANNNIEGIKDNCYNSFLESILTIKEFKLVYDEICKYEKPFLSGSGSTLYIISHDINYLQNIKNKLPFTTILTNVYNSNL